VDDGRSQQAKCSALGRHDVRRVGGGNDVISRLAAASSRPATLQTGRTATAPARTAP